MLHGLSARALDGHSVSRAILRLEVLAGAQARQLTVYHDANAIAQLVCFVHVVRGQHNSALCVAPCCPPTSKKKRMHTLVKIIHYNHGWSSIIMYDVLIKCMPYNICACILNKDMHTKV